jgi:hypothetical protein
VSAYCLMVKTEGLHAGPSDIGSNPIGRFDSVLLESRHEKIIIIPFASPVCSTAKLDCHGKHSPRLLILLFSG